MNTKKKYPVIPGESAALGNMRDSTELLERAMSYLREEL